MLKKLGGVISLLIIVLAVMVINAQPVFKDYASEYEVYLNDASSLAEIRKVDKLEYYFLRGVKGESVTLSAKGFELESILSDFGARVVFTENLSNATVYYAYSPKIKSQKTVRGEKINLQVAISGERVVLGAPLIFGSF